MIFDDKYSHQRSEENPFYKHGYARRGKKTKEYITWEKIRARCLGKNNKDYKYYGGRGIKICQSWLDSFESFLSDMGQAPSKKHSIDRINVNGNYEPENCRWTTQNVQCQNKRQLRKSNSGHRGIYKKYVKGKWNGNYEVAINGSYLLFTNDIEKAMHAYDKEALIRYGEHAMLNKPEKREQYLKELSNDI
jgi:hypothetical protein